LQHFDEDLSKAVSKDMSTYMGEVISSISFRANTPGLNGTRTKQVFTRFGWCEVRHPYRVGNPEESDVFKAFGIERKMTKSASKKEARDALNYLDKRRKKMRYEWLRKNGYYISSCHIEAAARIIVARRCKQAGMHWRHHNAACVCAIIAKLRSAA
jgi:hypothetical protein